jgi:hypothetical protein
MPPNRNVQLARTRRKPKTNEGIIILVLYIVYLYCTIVLEYIALMMIANLYVRNALLFLVQGLPAAMEQVCDEMGIIYLLVEFYIQHFNGIFQY